MIKVPFLFWLLSLFIAPAPAAEATVAHVEEHIAEEVPAAELAYHEIGLLGQLNADVFIAGFNSVDAHNETGRFLAIADMSQPSTAKRLYIIDLEARQLVMRTYVAHGQKSGELMAQYFGNEDGSHKTSLGLYRVGVEIKSPKHGAALLLHGLDKGKNCQALAREVIMHGADYVSEDFIKSNGRLGRSWGCPAVSRVDMPRMIELLGNGGLLYVHGQAAA